MLIYCFIILFFIDTFYILSFHAETCLLDFLMPLGKNRLHGTST